MNRAEKRRQKKLAKKAARNAKLGKATSRSHGQKTLAIQESIDLAVQHLNAGRLPEAESIYQQILQADPNQPVALHLLGVISHLMGKPDVAVDLITKALAIKPDYAEAHNNIGNVHRALWKLEEAVANYQKALAIKPDYAEAHNNLGTAFKELGRLDEAVASYHEAFAIRPDYAEAHYNLGNVLKELGQLDGAVTSYQKALAIKSDYAKAHNNLGNALQELGRLDEAIECLKRADSGNANAITSATLLECYYRNWDREGFARQLERISKNQGFNFRAAAANAFVSHQWGTENSYEFCDRPIDLVSEYDLSDSGEVSPDLITEIETMVENNTGNERFAPGHISAGFKSNGNLFAENSPIAETLEQVIRRCVGSFVHRHNDNKSRLFRDWPAQYVLDGWYIRLLNGGDITAHVHEGWLSGVFYVRVPAEKENDAGNIEFTLHGYDLPVIRDDFPSRVVTTQPGRLVLFPSSLPHRVFTFSENLERISISFDIVPA